MQWSTRLAAMPLIMLVLCSTNIHAAAIPVGSGVTVTCTMSDNSACTPIGALAWAIPENGGINPPTEPATEPSISLIFNVPFTNSGTFRILDPADPTGAPCPQSGYPLTCVSDLVSFGNNVNGVGVILFVSDPNVLTMTSGNFPVGCTESAVAGCSFSFNVVAPPINALNVSVFSDGDFPSPGSAVTSDTITVTTPEPSFLSLGAGLCAFLLISRNIKSKLKR
jgi:hypothetical protein